MKMTALIFRITLNCCFLLAVNLPAFGEGSRILASGGVTQIEGAAGAGLSPWAVIAGYAQQDEVGYTLAQSRLVVDDFQLNVSALAIGIDNRYEFSFARQSFDLGPLANAFGFNAGNLEQDIYGFKVKLFGELIYSAWPQISAGLQRKKLRDFQIAELAGADKPQSNDYYLAASKIWLDGWHGFPIMVNMSYRSSEANQSGLLGFGSDKSSSRKWLAEVGANVFIERNWVLGFEFKQKPDNLSFAKEEHWRDIYLAWFYNRSVSGTLSWVDLGDVAGQQKQQGLYLSIQLTF